MKFFKKLYRFELKPRYFDQVSICYWSTYAKNDDEALRNFMSDDDLKMDYVILRITTR